MGTSIGVIAWLIWGPSTGIAALRVEASTNRSLSTVRWFVASKDRGMHKSSRHSSRAAMVGILFMTTPPRRNYGATGAGITIR